VSVRRLLSVAILAAALLARPVAVLADGSVDAFAEGLQAAFTALQSGRCDAPKWRTLVSDPSLATAPGSIRSIAYVGAAMCIGGPQAHDWIRKATDEGDATPWVWGVRFGDDVRRKDTEDALHVLEVTGARSEWTHLETYSDETLSMFWRNVRTDKVAERRLLGLLDRGHWTPTNPAADASPLWADLAEALLQEGKPDDATRVARRITLPSVLFRMRVDKRFDEISAADPQLFDVETAARAVLKRHQADYAVMPNRDDVAGEIIRDLQLLNRLDEALALADKTLAKARVTDGRGGDHRNWIEDYRARILDDLGRHDEALSIEEAATARLERGHPNVSQRINLAGMMIASGRHEDVLKTLAPFDDKGLSVSPYGAMWVAAERSCAAGALGREQVKAAAMSFTAVHAADNKGARLKALLCANDLAGARELVVGWLANPDDRAYALVQLCSFAKTPLAPFEAELDRRFEVVRTDPAVIAAAAKVGRVETTPLNGSIWIDSL
jgi:hypothetical protein